MERGGGADDLALTTRPLNKRPTGLNGHLSIQDFTLTSFQTINSPIIEKLKIDSGIGKQHYIRLIL